MPTPSLNFVFLRAFHFHLGNIRELASNIGGGLRNQFSHCEQCVCPFIKSRVVSHTQRPHMQRARLSGGGDNTARLGCGCLVTGTTEGPAGLGHLLPTRAPNCQLSWHLENPSGNVLLRTDLRVRFGASIKLGSRTGKSSQRKQMPSVGAQRHKQWCSRWPKAAPALSFVSSLWNTVKRLT